MIRVRIRLRVWLVSCYARVFVRLSVVIVTDRCYTGPQDIITTAEWSPHVTYTHNVLSMTMVTVAESVPAEFSAVQTYTPASACRTCAIRNLPPLTCTQQVSAIFANENENENRMRFTDENDFLCHTSASC